MKTSRHASLVLATLLNFAPFLARNLPAAPRLAASPAGILFKWVVGAFAFAGSMHAVSAASAALVSAKTVSGTTGTRLSYQIRINDGSNRLPGSWLIGGKSFAKSGSTTNGMPPGLSLSLSTAIISGTPTQAGSFPVTLTAYEDPGLRGAKLAFTVTFTIAGTAVPPAVAAQPQGGTVTEGGSFTFSVTATGDAPLSYQWLHGTTQIPGATAATLTLSPVTLGDAGSYSVTVSNLAGAVTSDPAELTVQALVVPTTLVSAPVDTSVHVGEALSLAVVAAGTGPFSYQWKRDGAPLGVTADTLTLAAATATDAGSYTVEVTGAGGSVASAPATVAVVPLGLTVPVVTPADIRITGSTIPGRQYVVEASSTLLEGSWSSVQEFTATAATFEFVQSNGSSVGTFWRYRVLP